MSLLATLSSAAAGAFELAGAGRNNDLGLAQLHKGIEDEKSFSRLDQAMNVSEEFKTLIRQDYGKKVEAAEASGDWTNVDSDAMREYEKVLKGKGMLTPSLVRKMLGKEAAISFANRTFLPELLGPGKYGNAATAIDVDTPAGSAIDIDVTTVDPETGEMYDAPITDGGVPMADGGVPLNGILTDEVMDTAFWTTVDENYDDAVNEAYSRVPGASRMQLRMGLTEMGNISREQYPEVRAAKQKVLEDRILELGGAEAAKVEELRATREQEQEAHRQRMGIEEYKAAESVRLANEARARGEVFEEPSEEGTTAGAAVGGEGVTDADGNLLMGDALAAAYENTPAYVSRLSSQENVVVDFPKSGTLPTINGQTLTRAQWESLPTPTKEQLFEDQQKNIAFLKTNLWDLDPNDTGDQINAKFGRFTSRRRRSDARAAAPNTPKNLLKRQIREANANALYGTDAQKQEVKSVENFYAQMKGNDKEAFLKYLQQNPDQLEAWRKDPLQFAKDHMNDINKIKGDPPPKEIRNIYTTHAEGIKPIDAKKVLDEFRKILPGAPVPSETIDNLLAQVDKSKKLTAEAENELVTFLEEDGDIRRMSDSNVLGLFAAISSTMPKDDPRSRAMFEAFAQKIPQYLEDKKWSFEGVKAEQTDRQLEDNDQNIALRGKELDQKIKQAEDDNNRDLIEDFKDARDYNQRERKANREILNSRGEMTDVGNTALTDLNALPFSTDVVNGGNADLTWDQKRDMSRPYFMELDSQMQRLANAAASPQGLTMPEQNDYIAFSSKQAMAFEKLLVEKLNANKSWWTSFVENLPWTIKSDARPGVLGSSGATNLIALDGKDEPTTDPNAVRKYMPYNPQTGVINTDYPLTVQQAGALYGQVEGIDYLNDSALYNAKHKLGKK